MKLEPLVRLKVELGSRYPIGEVHVGRRTVWTLAGGEAVGPRIQATVLPVGGEFELIDGDGVYRMDVRMLWKTHDGANIYVQYYGVGILTPESEQKLRAGHEIQFGEQHFFTQPRFETSDERYDWLNPLVAVAEGRMFPGAVEYRMYNCLPSKEDVSPADFSYRG